MTQQDRDFLAALHPHGCRELRAIPKNKQERTTAVALDVDNLDGVSRYIDTVGKSRDLYIGVATRDHDRQPVALHALFTDIDNKDFATEAEARESLAAFPLKPSAIVQSGGGLHVYWISRTPIDLTNGGAPRAKTLLRKLAAVTGGDMRSAEPARILRLPGSVNHKYSPSRPVTLETFTEAHDLHDLETALVDVPEPKPEPTRATPPVTSLDDIPEGDRNASLFREGSRLRRLGHSPDDIRERLITLNMEQCNPPLSVQEIATIAASAARYEPASDPYSLSDTGNSQYFAKLNATRLRYDHRERVWFLYGDHHWGEDRTGAVDRLALETVHARQRAAVGNEAASKWATRSLSRSARDNLLRLARSEHPLAVAGDEWDLNPWVIGVQGRVIDLQTGVPRDGRADDFITKVAPVAFDAGAECPRWRQFLAEIFSDNPELIDYMQRVAGYILTGITTEQCFFVLHGVGANGKTTFIETLRHMLGHDFCWSMPFPSASWSDNISEYQRAELVGRRLVVTSELSKQKELNTELIKSLTGSDRINARRVRERPFTFTPTAKFVLAVNDPPVIEDTSVGMWRRVKLIPFLQSFDAPDTTLGEALRAEAPGILTWAVEGCLKWQRDGLQHPECVTAATAEYRQESDPFQNFVTERCTTDGRGSVGATALFEAFSSWSPDNGMSQRAFGKRIRTLPNVTIQHRRDGVFYEGIAQLVDGDARYEM